MDIERKIPNILITGTPGVGKTSTASMIAEQLGYKHINVSQYIVEKGYHAGKDEAFDTFILDEDSEDKLLDDMEITLTEGGCVVDYHCCELFPERWFDLVLVLRTDNTNLYDRLKSRGYNEKKLTENIECEIMEVVLSEARGAYTAEIVQVRASNDVDDMEQNCEDVCAWAKQFVTDHA